MQPLKILVIDDEQLIRWSFEKNLKPRVIPYSALKAEKRGYNSVSRSFLTLCL